MKALINGKIIHERKVLDGYTLLFDKKIIALSRNRPPAQCEVIDAEGCYVSAGFVDMHIHGSGGADVMDATPEALERISAAVLKNGTTSFVATTMTMSQASILDAIENVIAYAPQVSGAKIRGLHLEGPFLNPAKSGAQDSHYIQAPNFDWITPYLDHIRVITIAPEMPGAEQFIRHITERYPSIILSIGHSDMDYDATLESFDWGISHATHLFNAMPPWHHRAPGIIGALFDSPVTADIIADLVHVHPSLLRSAQKLKKDKLILITDAMRAGCMKSGTYDLGGQQVTVSEGEATLENGVLAGSVLKLNEAVKNYYTLTEASLAEALFSVTTLPAQRLGLPCGVLKEGLDADIVIFDDEIEIKSVYIDGHIKYNWRN